MDAWKMNFLLGWPILGGEPLVSGSVPPATITWRLPAFWGGPFSGDTLIFHHFRGGKIFSLDHGLLILPILLIADNVIVQPNIACLQEPHCADFAAVIAKIYNMNLVYFPSEIWQIPKISRYFSKIIKSHHFAHPCSKFQGVYYIPWKDVSIHGLRCMCVLARQFMKLLAPVVGLGRNNEEDLLGDSENDCWWLKSG